MNIAIISGSFLPQINGVLSYVLDTATELSKRGHAVTIFAPAPAPAKKTIIDISKYPFSIVLLPSVSAVVYPDLRLTKPALYQLTKAFRDLSIEVVHINDPLPISIEAMVAAKLQKLPIVLTFHTFYLDKDFMKNFRFNTMFTFLKYPLTRLNINFHNYADVVICPSVSGQRELLNYGLTSRSVVIPNGIDDALIARDIYANREKNRKRFGLDLQDHVAIFVGRLSIEKSVDVLIKSWVIVRAHDPKAMLMIVGYGPMEQKLRQLAKKLGVGSSVIFTGCISRRELLRQSIYACADIYVSASKIENQSMSMIEAMAHGLPIVATNKRGVSELVDETNGIPVTSGARPIAKGVITLFSDEVRRKKLSLGSIKKSKEHCTSHTVKLLENEYVQVIESAKN